MRIYRSFIVVALALVLCALPVVSVWSAAPPVDPTSSARQVVAAIEFAGEVTLPTGLQFAGTAVGGLSGLVYDPSNETYYALSGDGQQDAAPRLYTLTIDTSDGRLDEGDIQFTGVTTLTGSSGEPLTAGSFDRAGIALAPDGQLYISWEGDPEAAPPDGPFIGRFSPDGRQAGLLTVPPKYTPLMSDTTPIAGIRHDLGLDSLTVTPDGRTLYAALENALVQDGPADSSEFVGLARILDLDLATGEPAAEFVYEVDPAAQPAQPVGAESTNALVGLLATDNNGSFLALERSCSESGENTVRLNEARLQGAVNVLSLDSLFWTEGDMPYVMDPGIVKHDLFDFTTAISSTADLRSMALGPELPDGRRVLVVVSDDDTAQHTQFVALAVEFHTIPAALPDRETPLSLDEVEAPAGTLTGDSDDPAIWVHPTDPALSLVIATKKDGGLAVFDLAAQVVQTIVPDTFGSVRYNNVDLVYGLPLGGQPTDLAVVSDMLNDVIVIYKIDPETRQLTDVTGPDAGKPVFAVGDGRHNAYGLATYTSPTTGKAYVFLTQRRGNLIAQLELADDGSGRVNATPVRMLQLPTPTGDPEGSEAEGMAIDRDRGLLYVNMTRVGGLYKFMADPGADDEPTLVHPMEAGFFTPEIEGLTIYYGPGESGYLLASNQGSSTYLVFERAGDNAYVGTFLVGNNGDVDRADETDGLDVNNTALGPNYPLGLLVVHDGANAPLLVAPDGEELENDNTNFKFIPWENVANAFSPPLLIDPAGGDPRIAPK